MAVVFALTSLVPVVAAIALVVFTGFLAVTGVAVIVVALGLSLLVLLSSALVFSVVATLVVSGVLWSKGSPAKPAGIAATEPANGERSGISDFWVPFRRAFTALQGRVKGRNWRYSLLAAVLLRNTFARIFLPRWMRYHPFYPYVFGRDRAPHPLKWVLIRAISSSPSAVAVAPFKFGRLVYRIISAVGLDPILLACVLVFVVSPRARPARNAALAALAGFLRTALGSLEKAAAADTPAAAPCTDAESPAAADAARDEVVPPVFSTPGQSAATTGVSTTGGIVPVVRARNVAAAGAA
ncbi:hypothetical protein B0H13DRAFT_2040487 [Mycena leptocephala]|nr:hypothetical protein B0H13DRAFT_2040487 [Mycena leptocephala]